MCRKACGFKSRLPHKDKAGRCRGNAFCMLKMENGRFDS